MDFISLENQGDRKEQQDAYFAQAHPSGMRLALVADGVGGQIGGRDAAQACKQIAHLWWQEHLLKPLPARDYLRGLFYNAHVRINEVAKRTGESPRAAVAAVLVQGGTAWLAHSGDCRIYVLRGDQLVHRSADHSVVQMLLDRGKISEDQMGLHPDKGKLLQCVGGAEFAEPDIVEFALQPGDRILLCSDGLWEHQTRDGIRLSMALGTRKALNDLIHDSVRRAAGKSDNIALIYFDAAGTLRGESLVPIWVVAIVVFIFGITALGIVAGIPLTRKIMAWRAKNTSAPEPVLPAGEVYGHGGSTNPPSVEPPKEPEPVVVTQPPPAPPPALKSPTDEPPPVASKVAPPSIGFDQQNGFTNSLNMKFVYAGTPMVYISVYETTITDWRTYLATRLPPENMPPLPENQKFPASSISAAEAEAFCTWLTLKEQTAGIIGANDRYDLPHDSEWISAAQPRREIKLASGKPIFPWEGEVFPPKKNNIANLGMLAAKPKSSYTDDFPEAAPVDSFEPHNYGLYNMGGNVAEWTVPMGVDGPPCLRGGGWTDFTAEAFSVTGHTPVADGAARLDSGFRCVLRIAQPTAGLQGGGKTGGIELNSPAPAVGGTSDPMAGQPVRRATPTLQENPGGPTTPPRGRDNPSGIQPRILLPAEEANAAITFIHCVNTGTQDPALVGSALLAIVNYNGQIGVKAPNLITDLHHWINSRGGPGGMMDLLTASTPVIAGNGPPTGSLLEFVVTTGDNQRYFYLAQIAFDPITHKISQIVRIDQTDNKADKFPAPDVISTLEIKTPVQPLERRPDQAPSSPAGSDQSSPSGRRRPPVTSS